APRNRPTSPHATPVNHVAVSPRESVRRATHQLDRFSLGLVWALRRHGHRRTRRRGPQIRPSAGPARTALRKSPAHPGTPTSGGHRYVRRCRYDERAHAHGRRTRHDVARADRAGTARWFRPGRVAGPLANAASTNSSSGRRLVGATLEYLAS